MLGAKSRLLRLRLHRAARPNVRVHVPEAKAVPRCLLVVMATHVQPRAPLVPETRVAVHTRKRGVRLAIRAQ